MTFHSWFRPALLGGTLCACVSQYTSPGGEVENTNKEGTGTESSGEESPTGTSDEPSQRAKPSREANDAPDEANRAPSEASGSCDDRTCVSTSDCCSGYQCGFDPERSKVMRYCLAQ